MVSFRRGTPGSVAAILVALAALGLYVGTMAPALTQAHGGTDGAELAVAVHTLGIPHPTGYPTYVLLAQIPRLLPWGSLAGRLNVFSALAAALTAGLVALIAVELFSDQQTCIPALVAALTAGLALAAAGLFWSQAIITEVYTLHTFFLALACWLLLRWRSSQARSEGRDLYLPLAGLACGLGLGNHTSLVLLLPGVVLFLALSRRHLRRGQLLLAVALMLAGLAVYLFLPLRAAADPWLNWGDPHDWSAFWAHVSGQAYRGYLFQVPWPQALGRVSAAAGLLWRDFAPWGVALGLAGLLLLGRDDRPTLLLIALPALAGLLLAITYGGSDSYVHLLPLYISWALGAGVAAGEITRILGRRFGGKVSWLALLLPLLSVVLAAVVGPTWNLRDDPGPLPGQAPALRALPDGALLLTNLDEQTFPLWYAQVVEGGYPALAAVDVRLLEWPWYRRQLPTRYPGLVIPGNAPTEDWFLTLLQANSDRPAFTLGSLALPPGYGLQNKGLLYRVIAP